MSVEVHPATAARWGDLRAVLNPRGHPYHCWCLYWRLSSSEFSSPRTPREARMRELVSRQPAPGLLAYLDGEPVGWCNVGPRAAMERLVRSRTIPAVDDTPVWSVVCFVVRAGHRRQGVAERLLQGAVDYAHGYRAPAIEGYPVDPGDRRLNTFEAYVGTTCMFERVGFRRVARTAATSAKLPRWLMRLELTGS